MEVEKSQLRTLCEAEKSPFSTVLEGAFVSTRSGTTVERWVCLLKIPRCSTGEVGTEQRRGRMDARTIELTLGGNRSH